MIASQSSSDGSFADNEMDMTVTQPGDLLLELSPFGLEHLYDYESGGHHPVHLGDLLGNEGRYRVVHKLGNGGAANIWLCSDTGPGNTTKYVAVKLLMADILTRRLS